MEISKKTLRGGEGSRKSWRYGLWRAQDIGKGGSLAMEVIMSGIREWIENGKMSLVFRVLLVIWDVLGINFCSFFALFLRYDLKWDQFLKSGIAADYPLGYVNTIKELAWINTIAALVIFMLFHMYNSLWRFAGFREMLNVIIACGFAGIANYLIVFGTYHRIPRSCFIIYMILLFLVTSAARFSYRLIRLLFTAYMHGEGMRNTMIIGGGDACNMLIRELQMSKKLDSRICCIIDDNKAKQGTYIHGIKVTGGRESIIEMAEKFGINEIIVAIPSASKREISTILNICQKTNAALKILPGVYQLVTGEVKVEKIRSVEIEDLLGREPVKTNLDSMINYVKNKVVLVTGGGGSIGSELCRQIAANRPKMLIIFDIYENNAYDIQQELIVKYPELHLEVLIGSVRNTARINQVFRDYRPDIVYHAAAHKHVPLMEDSPNEAIKNNVFGTYKTALAADKYGTGKFVLISTDKAVNPTNIMGASKRICEMIIQALDKKSDTEFVAVRFGNVLGSNGSVIPLFKRQIAAGGPVRVTHPDIIRYFMTIPEAVALVIQAGVLAKGGEIFVLDMGEPVKIDDLAKKLIHLTGYTLDVDMKIEYIGLRPGEKLFEEMLMDEEGLTETDNSRIHVGKPIEFDEEIFFEKLEELYESAYHETDNMKEIVAQLVPTYRIRKDDIKRDREMKDSRQRMFYERELSKSGQR